MSIVIIADEVFAVREQAMLARLEIGLAEAGKRVVHAVPESASPPTDAALHARVVTYTPRRWRWGFGATARTLAHNLTSSDDGTPAEQVHVVHVFGGAAWGIAAYLAEEVGAHLVVEVWRVGAAAAAAELATSHAMPTLFMAPDPSIARALRAASTSLIVRDAPWGVHSPAQARPLLAPEQTHAAMMIGTGRDAAGFAAALEGLAAAARRRNDLMIFCDADAGARAGLHAVAHRLNILPRISFIAQLEGRRDLILQGDLLIQPEALGEQRSITLDAMAAGLPVLAAADPGVEYLIDGRTARLVPAGSPEAWSRAIAGVLDDPPAARSLAESARAYARLNRRASDQIRAMLDAYTWTLAANAIPFRAPA